jgi:hypothetical protein
VAALWPHVWLLVRLVAFTYWFSYTDPSWERWLSLVLALAVVFAINTGLLNGVVQQAFHPVREQLEGMIPFAEPGREGQGQGQQQGGQQNAQNQQQDQPNQHGDGAAGSQHNNATGNGAAAASPDPAQAAARLVAQRRVNNGAWLREQARRIERAGILFLASFAPGVAERHIQQLEERERAERRAAEEARAAAEQARVAAEEAARAAAEEVEAGAQAETGAQQQEGGLRADGAPAAVTAEDGGDQQHEPRVQPPLVDV